MSKVRHIMGISGGKDSAALAIHMRDKISDMEYVFCDTGSELKETYDFIKRLEAYLNKKIIHLPQELEGYSKTYDFNHVLDLYGGYLPSTQARWCTKKLKLEPFEKYIGDKEVINYVGIRYDENRQGYISTKSNVKTVFPFIKDKIDIRGVSQILERSGVGVPSYYEWRSRSGCYFCFFQSKKEWIGLKENHPDLYEKAKKYEKDGYTWREDMSLIELEEYVDEIKNNQKNGRMGKSNLLAHILDDDFDENNIEKPCLICHL